MVRNNNSYWLDENGDEIDFDQFCKDYDQELIEEHREIVCGVDLEEEARYDASIREAEKKYISSRAFILEEYPCLAEIIRKIESEEWGSLEQSLDVSLLEIINERRKEEGSHLTLKDYFLMYHVPGYEWCREQKQQE